MTFNDSVNKKTKTTIFDVTVRASQQVNSAKWHPHGLRRALVALLAVGLCLLGGAIQSGAQAVTATMFGSVTDPTGAVVPNAAVVITQTQTNFIRQTKTNDQGE